MTNVGRARPGNSRSAQKVTFLMVSCSSAGPMPMRIIIDVSGGDMAKEMGQFLLRCSVAKGNPFHVEPLQNLVEARVAPLVSGHRELRK